MESGRSESLCSSAFMDDQVSGLHLKALPTQLLHLSQCSHRQILCTCVTLQLLCMHNAVTSSLASLALWSNGKTCNMSITSLQQSWNNLWYYRSNPVTAL